MFFFLEKTCLFLVLRTAFVLFFGLCIEYFDTLTFLANFETAGGFYLDR